MYVAQTTRAFLEPVRAPGCASAGGRRWSRRERRVWRGRGRRNKRRGNSWPLRTDRREGSEPSLPTKRVLLKWSSLLLLVETLCRSQPPVRGSQSTLPRLSGTKQRVRICPASHRVAGAVVTAQPFPAGFPCPGPALHPHPLGALSRGCWQAPLRPGRGTQ